MMDFIRQFQVTGRRSLTGMFSGGTPRSGRPRARNTVCVVEQLERRELLATVQNFDTAGTAYVLQQTGTPPAATVVPGGPTGSFLQMTSATALIGQQNNSISFVTSDPGTYNEITADFSPTFAGKN